MKESIEQFGQSVEPHQRKDASGKLQYVSTYIRSGIDNPDNKSKEGEGEGLEGELNPTLQYIMADLMVHSEEHILPEKFLNELDAYIESYMIMDEMLKTLVSSFDGVNQARQSKAYQLTVKRSADILEEINRLSKFDSHFGYNEHFETDAVKVVVNLINSKNLYNYYNIVYLPEAKDILLRNPNLKSIIMYRKITSSKINVFLDEMLESESNIMEIYAKQLKLDIEERLISADECDDMYKQIEDKFIACEEMKIKSLKYFNTIVNNNKSKKYKAKQIFGYRGKQNTERILESLHNSFNNLNDRYQTALVKFNEYDKKRFPELKLEYNILMGVLIDLEFELTKEIENNETEEVIKIGTYYKNSVAVISSYISKINKEIDDKINDQITKGTKVIDDMIIEGINNAQITE